MGDVEAATEKPEVTAEFIAGLYRQHGVEPSQTEYLCSASDRFCGCPIGILAAHAFGFADASDARFTPMYERDIAAAYGISRSRLDGIEAGFCWPKPIEEMERDRSPEFLTGHAIGLATYKILTDLPRSR